MERVEPKSFEMSVMKTRWRYPVWAGSVVMLLVLALLWTGCGSQENGAGTRTTAHPGDRRADVRGAEGGPYYFIAVHNEPCHRPNGRQQIAESYAILKEMVERADEYNVKLTLMFSAQWAGYIAESPERLAEVRSWKERGHEIAAHHHDIYHGNWDGYTDYPREEVEAMRVRMWGFSEEYLGTLDDYMRELHRIDPDIKSGCLNDEFDKRALPDEIIYDTGSGFANHGEPGTREDDRTSPSKGVNEFVTVGTVKGIERKWLAHYQITNPQRTKAAMEAFGKLDGGVYGVVLHSTTSEAQELYEFLEFLHQYDPDGRYSKTVTEIIEEGLLPEVRLSDEVINETYEQEVPGWEKKG